MRASVGEQHPSTAKSYSQLAFLYIFQNQLDTAEFYFQRARHIFQNTLGEHHPELQNFYANLGYFYDRCGDYEQAILCYEKSTTLVRQANNADPFKIANNLNNIGEALRARGDYPAALARFRQALALSSPQHPFGQVYLNSWRGNLATCLSDMGHHTEAVALLDSVIRSKKQGHDPTWVLQANGLTASLLKLGRTSEARQRIMEALHRPETGNKIPLTPAERIDCTTSLADCLAAENRPAEALKHYDAALSLLQISDSASLSLHAQTMYLVDNALLGKADVLVQLADNQTALAPLETAFRHLLLTVQWFDYQRQTFNESRSAQELLAQNLGVFESAIGLAERLFRKTGAPRYLESAFQLAEKSKNYLLFAQLRGRDAAAIPITIGTALPDSLRAKLESLTNQIATTKTALADAQNPENGQAQPPEKIKPLADRLFGLQQRHNLLREELAKKYPSWFAARFGHPVPTLAELRQRLRPDEVFVEYFLGKKQLFRFTATAAKTEFEGFWLDQNFAEALRFFTDTLPNLPAATEPGSATQRLDFQKFVQQNRRLARLLLPQNLAAEKQKDAGEDANIGQQKLILAPDGLLARLPFDVLLTADPSVEQLAAADYRALPFLLRRCAVRQEFSAAIWLENSAARRPASQPYAGFGPAFLKKEVAAAPADFLQKPMFAAAFPHLLRGGERGPLSQNVPEILAGARLFGGRAFVAGQATESAWWAAAGRAAVLHISSHACTNDTLPGYSFFALNSLDSASTNDGLVCAYELENQVLVAQITVVNGCHTGAGMVLNGEGVQSLARAFRQAGCASTVTSLWAVDDAAGAALVLRFLEKIRAGQPKDEALRRAKLDFLENGASRETGHPFFWGGLVFSGDAAPVVLPTWWAQWAREIAVGSLLLLIFGLLWRIFFRAEKRLREV